MKLQDRKLSIKTQGDDVKLLHSELRQLGFTIADKESDSSLFGDSTFKAVQDFQLKQGLKQTGEVDGATAALINKMVDALSPSLQPPPVLVPTSAVEKPASSPLTELGKIIKVDLPQKLLAHLAKLGIQTLDDIRKAGGLTHLDGLPVAVDSPAVKILEAHSRLTTLSSDVQLNSFLIQKGYDSPAAIANVTRSKFVTTVQEKLGAFEADQLQVTAQAQTNFLSNVWTDFASDFANGFSLDIDNPRIQSLFEVRCQCTDCEAALSPLAYLVDLLDYALTHLTNADAPIMLRFLTQTFHQPFGELRASCRSAEEQVRQVRICIEVLRSFLGTRPLNPERVQAEQQYRLAAYTSLLTRIGTSYEEGRQSRTASAGERNRLADRLGIPVTHLNELFLEPAAITEAVLEQLFGLVDTSRNPLAAGSIPQLQAWRLEHLHGLWQDQDWPADWATRSLPPIIDPDLIDLGHLKTPSPGDAAYDLWRTRSRWIDDRLRDFQRIRTEAGADFRIALRRMLELAGLPAVEALQALEVGRSEGNSISARLSELNLSFEAFNRLRQIGQLVMSGQTPLDSEWRDADFILVAVWKRGRFLAWRTEEREARITLSPTHFKIPESSAAELSPLDPEPLPAWRASAGALRQWWEILQARANQETAVVEALQQAVSATEENTLPMLRDVLIMAAAPGAGDLGVKAKWVTDQFLIDSKAGGCQMTTRVAQAIETLQGVLFSVRTGQLLDSYPRLALNADNFDGEWEWIGSYATWRAAMFVFLYPENLLLPSLRKWQTPVFRKLVDDLQSNRRLTPEQACLAANEYSEYLREVCNLTLETTCRARTQIYSGESCRNRAARDQRTLLYLFARSTLSGKIYWSTYDPTNASGYAQTSWKQVPGLERVRSLPGAQPYYVPAGSRFIFLFARTNDNKLLFNKYDLDRAQWDSQPTELEVKINNLVRIDFTVVVRQVAQESAQPILHINTFDGIYFRALNPQGSGWDSGEWHSTRLPSDPSFPRSREILAACVSVGNEEYYLVRSDAGQILAIRVVGSGYSAVGTGPFRGAFTWPGSHDLCVFFGDGISTSYRFVTLTTVSTASTLADSPGFSRLVWTSGMEPPGSSVRTQFAIQRSNGRIERRTLSRSGFDLVASEGVPLAPSLIGVSSANEAFFEIKSAAPGDDLQGRRTMIESAFRANASTPQANIAYLEEAYYFVPMYLGLQLQQRGQYTAALDWFRSVYDYSAPPEQRKIYYGLTLETSLSAVYRRAGEWLLDPLNPHVLASTRRNSYTRFTIVSLVTCLLEYADAEFTRDTSESNSRARILYLTALELLDLPAFRQNLFPCDNVLQQLSLLVNDARSLPVWNTITTDFSRIDTLAKANTVLNAAKATLKNNDSSEDRLATLQTIVARAAAETPVPSTLADVLDAKANGLSASYNALLAQPEIVAALTQVGTMAAQDLVRSTQSGSVPATLVTQKAAQLQSSPELPTATQDKAVNSPLGQPRQTVIQNNRAYLSTPLYAHFCIPPNPVLGALRLHTELNLYKLRHCRNIAGMLRQVEPYAAPTDAISGLPQIGVGGRLPLPGRAPLRPTQYRYAVLIERAKQLAQLAGQVEAGLLSALEKRDAEYYNLLRARQDARLARAGVRLQDLRVREAEDGVGLAALQQTRAQIQVNHYQRLISEGLSGWEVAALVFQTAAVVHFHVAAAITEAMTMGIGGIGEVGTALAATSSLFQMQASFERRSQEWEFSRTLSEQDVRIGAQQVRLANDHVIVAGQERLIATMQTEHAEVVVDFLANKFTNVELYEWMSNVLERVYHFFLQQATAIAQLAANQLAFERQQASPTFIQADYWEALTDGPTSGSPAGQSPDRRGLTGSARLLQDIYQLDQYAFETNKRQLQLIKTISLARLAPAEFQRFRESGVMQFETTMDMFDRDFPGHYLRLIKRVRTSVIALVPPAQGIRATLATTGTSRVVIGGNIFQTVVVRRDPESVALSSPRDATGLFELDPQAEMLMPFEGSGVAAQWEFQLPKAANLFDYNTIADVLITIEYTALDSFDYHQQVTQQLNRDRAIGAERPFSFRHQFADQWYDLNNPEQTTTPMSVRFTTVPEDFPPNLDELRIQHVVLYFARAARQSFEVPVDHLHFTQRGDRTPAGGSATSVDGIISTRRSNAASWASMVGKAPSGEWELALPNTEDMKNRFKNEQIEDILFVITYSGRAPEWPALR